MCTCCNTIHKMENMWKRKSASTFTFSQLHLHQYKSSIYQLQMESMHYIYNEYNSFANKIPTTSLIQIMKKIERILNNWFQRSICLLKEKQTSFSLIRGHTKWNTLLHVFACWLTYLDVTAWSLNPSAVSDVCSVDMTNKQCYWHPKG